MTVVVESVRICEVGNIKAERRRYLHFRRVLKMNQQNQMLNLNVGFGQPITDKLPFAQSQCSSQSSSKEAADARNARAVLATRGRAVVVLSLIHI